MSHEKRERKRKGYVNAIWQALPKRERAQVPQGEIDPLVKVETWNQKGEAFEFAHFTDHQIAKAILATYYGPDVHSLADLHERVGNLRRKAGNIEHLWKGWNGRQPTKIDIAGALWPVLERRIQRARVGNTHDRIPVVRIVLHAARTAARSHRHSVMIQRA